MFFREENVLDFELFYFEINRGKVKTFYTFEK